MADTAKRDETDTQFSFNSVAHGMIRIAKENGEWAGIPMPLENESLIVEKSYPFAKGFMSLPKATNGTYTHVCRNEDVDETTRLRNTFWSVKWHSDIDIWETRGKIKWGLHPKLHGFPYVLHTLGCADAWSLETECTALETLRSLTSLRQFRQYLLTGTFLETSKRSGVIYMFRRLRPTVAITPHHPSGELHILCSLCLHPVAYYADSWAGAQTPSDDVLAHLSLMRGDEHMFWKRANQHAAYRPESGL